MAVVPGFPLKVLGAASLQATAMKQTAKQRSDDAISIVCVSNTHMTQPNVPCGDLWTQAGDFTQAGSLEEFQEALVWLKSLRHPHKVVIADNHDMTLDIKDKARLNLGGVTYLEGISTCIKISNGRELNVNGSPWSQLLVPGLFRIHEKRTCGLALFLWIQMSL